MMCLQTMLRLTSMHCNAVNNMMMIMTMMAATMMMMTMMMKMMILQAEGCLQTMLILTCRMVNNCFSQLNWVEVRY